MLITALSGILVVLGSNLDQLRDGKDVLMQFWEWLKECKDDKAHEDDADADDKVSIAEGHGIEDVEVSFGGDPKENPTSS